MIKRNVRIFLALCLLQAGLRAELPSPQQARSGLPPQHANGGRAGDPGRVGDPAAQADSAPGPRAVVAKDVAAKIDARYNGMKSLTAEFTEIYSNGALQRSESGTLKIKKPGRMRWDYTSPREKLFLTDGSTAWFYVPGERQARRASVKKLDDLRSPLRYLLGRTKLAKELRGLSLAGDVPPETGGDVMLRGVPVGMEDRISQVLLESDAQGYLRRIVMEELDGSRTEFRLSSQRENLSMDDAEFRFHPPAGVEVLKSEQLQP